MTEATNRPLLRPLPPDFLHIAAPCITCAMQLRFVLYDPMLCQSFENDRPRVRSRKAICTMLLYTQNTPLGTTRNVQR